MTTRSSPKAPTAAASPRSATAAAEKQQKQTVEEKTSPKATTSAASPRSATAASPPKAATAASPPKAATAAAPPKAATASAPPKAATAAAPPKAATAATAPKATTSAAERQQKQAAEAKASPKAATPNAATQQKQAAEAKASPKAATPAIEKHQAQAAKEEPQEQSSQGETGPPFTKQKSNNSEGSHSSQEEPSILYKLKVAVLKLNGHPSAADAPSEADAQEGATSLCCMVDIEEKPGQQVKIQIGSGEEAKYVTGFTDGQSLEFRVCKLIDGEEALLGRGLLNSDRFIPHGVSGLDLKLFEVERGVNASITIDVQVLTDLKITICSGKHFECLNQLRGITTVDTYCSVEHESESTEVHQTPVKKNTFDPRWYHTIRFADYMVGMSLVFKVWDNSSQSDSLGFGSLLSEDFEYIGRSTIDDAIIINLTSKDKAQDKKQRRSLAGKHLLPPHTPNLTVRVEGWQKHRDIFSDTPAHQNAATLMQSRYRSIAEQISAIQKMKTFVNKRKIETQGLLDKERDELGRRHGTVLVEVRSARRLAESTYSTKGSVYIRIISARNIRRGDPRGKPNTYCTVEIEGNPDSKCSSRISAHTAEPLWDEGVELFNWSPGEGLEFKIWDKLDNGEEDLVGHITMPSAQFSNVEKGNKELRLEGTKHGTMSYLKVRVDLVIAAITIESATGLRRQREMAALKCDAFCRCEVRGKPHCSFTTEVLTNTRVPRWHHREAITDLTLQDQLEFSVFHREENESHEDKCLGRVTLPCDQLLSGGFSGELLLTDLPIDTNAKLKVKIQVPATAVFCECQFPAKPHTTISTRFVAYNEEPAWEERVIDVEVPFSKDWHSVFEKKIKVALERGARRRLTVHDRNNRDLGLSRNFEGQPELAHTPDADLFPLKIKAHEHELSFFELGDPIDITVWEQNGLDQTRTKLGVARLLTSQIMWPGAPDGFSGALHLIDEETGQDLGSSVRIKARHVPPSAEMSSSGDEDEEPSRVKQATNEERWNIHGLGGGEIYAIGKRYREFFAVISRIDFEHIVTSLERGTMHTQAAAAELRAADRRSGSQRCWRDFRKSRNIVAFAVKELRDTFERLKGFLGYTFGYLDSQLTVADTEARRERMRAKAETLAAIRIQCMTRVYLAKRKMRQLKRDKSHTNKYDCFRTRCNAPPEIGTYVKVEMRLYHIATAKVTIILTLPDGQTRKNEFNYATKTAGGGVVEFSPLVAGKSVKSSVAFVCVITGQAGQRRLTLRHGFPILGEYWHELPPLLEYKHHHEEVDEEEQQADTLDSPIIEPTLPTVLTKKQAKKDDDHSSTRLASKPREDKKLLSGWLEVLAPNMKFSWRWCILYDNKVVIAESKEYSIAHHEIRLTPRLHFTSFIDKRIHEMDVPAVVRSGARRFGFMLEPEGLRKGDRFFFDAGEGAFFKKWEKEFKNAVVILEKIALPALAREVATRCRKKFNHAFEAARDKSAVKLTWDILCHKHDAGNRGFLSRQMFTNLVRQDLMLSPAKVTDEDLSDFFFFIESQVDEERSNKGLPKWPDEKKLTVSALVNFFTADPTDGAPAKEPEVTEADMYRRKALHSVPTSLSGGGRKAGASREYSFSNYYAIVWYRHDHVQGRFTEGLDFAKSTYQSKEPEYLHQDGLLALALFGRQCEKIRYYGSHLVLDDLLEWREKHLPEVPQRPDRRETTLNRATTDTRATTVRRATTKRD